MAQNAKRLIWTPACRKFVTSVIIVALPVVDRNSAVVCEYSECGGMAGGFVIVQYEDCAGCNLSFFWGIFVSIILFRLSPNRRCDAE